MQKSIQKPHASLISVPDEPDIDNSVCKIKKRLLHLTNKELRYTKKDITAYHLWGDCPPLFPAIQAFVNMYISAVLKM
jgi:hypothetical protein